MTRSHRVLTVVALVGAAAWIVSSLQGQSGKKAPGVGTTPQQIGAPAFEPRVLAAFENKRLLISVGLPVQSKKLVGVELRDGLGKSLSVRDVKAGAEANAVAAFSFDDVSRADADKLQLRVRFDNTQADVPLAKVLLAKGHETLVSAGAEFHAGSIAAIGCTVQGFRSVAESVPHVGAAVAITLIDAEKNKHPLFSGVTDSEGKVLASFDVPALPAGQYTLQITSRSPLGAETLQRLVTIKADAKILLVSDRPIYQPGHLIHLRALALRSFDMKPLENKDLLFEIEDPKGNKVFKGNFKTSDFGVASVDFQLADEVNMGDYTIRANIGDLRAEKTVNVKRYVLPKFKVEVKADKAFYLPKEKINVELQSDYFFGKPVANSRIEAAASTFDVAFKEFAKWKGMTDANGHAKFEIQLPDYFVGQPLQAGNAIVKLDVKVLDNADHTEKVTRSYAVSDQPMRINAISEGGKLAPGLANRIFLAATYPDGSPAANAEIKVWHKKLADAPLGMPLQPKAGKNGPKAEKAGPPLAVVKTNSAGLAEFTLTPKSADFRVGAWDAINVEMIGGLQQRFGPLPVYDLRLEAKDTRGNRATAAAALNVQPLGENVLLRLDKAIYQTGERMNIDVRTSAGMPTVYVDIVRGGQIMLSKWLEVKDGRAAQPLDLPPTVFGSLEIR